MARQIIKYEQVRLTINAPGELVLWEGATDKLYKRLTGVNVISTGVVDSKFSKLYMEIDSVEMFPRDWEVLRLLFRENAPYGFDYQELNQKAEGSMVKFEYRDLPPMQMPNPLPYPYQVVISLRLENDKPIETTISNPQQAK